VSPDPVEEARQEKNRAWERLGEAQVAFDAAAKRYEEAVRAALVKGADQ